MASVNAPEILQIKITLLDVRPPVWRRVQVPRDLTLRRLHDVIQAAMGWFDCHLHQFEIGDRTYGQAELEEGDDAFGFRLYNDKNTRLNKLVEWNVDRFVYTYDFGDGWEHEIRIEKDARAEPGVEYPIFIDGKRRCPPEDCGGPPGFEEFLHAVNDENHPEHEDLLAWYGEPFDPDNLELDTVEAMLSRIRGQRRKGPRKGPGKGKRVWRRV